jgi:hypothetical protein
VGHRTSLDVVVKRKPSTIPLSYPGSTVMWEETKLSEDHAVSMFRVKMVSYHITTPCNNSENSDLNLHCHANL